MGLLVSCDRRCLHSWRYNVESVIMISTLAVFWFIFMEWYPNGILISMAISAVSFTYLWKVPRIIHDDEDDKRE